MQWPAPPHVLLGAYCAGLCLVLAWRPPLAALLAAVALAAGVLAVAARAESAPLTADGLRERRVVAVTAALALLFLAAGAAIGGAPARRCSRARRSRPTSGSTSPSRPC